MITWPEQFRRRGWRRWSWRAGRQCRRGRWCWASWTGPRRWRPARGYRGAVQARAGDEVGDEVHFGSAAWPVGAPDVLERLPIRVPLRGRDGGGFELAQMLLHELHRVGDHERLPQNGRREEECGRRPTGRRRVVESEHTGRRVQVCGEGFLHGAQSELPRGRPLRYQAVRHGLP